MKAELPYAQAFLDLNEIHARRIAALKPGKLPNARGNTFEEAKAELTRKLKEFLEAKSKEGAAETETFAKATKYGADKKKVREWAAEIRKRLEATPATTVPYTEAAAPRLRHHLLVRFRPLFPPRARFLNASECGSRHGAAISGCCASRSRRVY